MWAVLEKNPDYFHELPKTDPYAAEEVEKLFGRIFIGYKALERKILAIPHCEIQKKKESIEITGLPHKITETDVIYTNMHLAKMRFAIVNLPFSRVDSTLKSNS